MTPFPLVFSHRLTYRGKSAITVPILLSSNVAVTLAAKLDTGSDLCVFNRIYADLLNLELKAAPPNALELPPALSWLTGMR